MLRRLWFQDEAADFLSVKGWCLCPGRERNSPSFVSIDYSTCFRSTFNSCQNHRSETLDTITMVFSASKASLCHARSGGHRALSLYCANSPRVRGRGRLYAIVLSRNGSTLSAGARLGIRCRRQRLISYRPCQPSESHMLPEPGSEIKSRLRALAQFATGESRRHRAARDLASKQPPPDKGKDSLDFVLETQHLGL